jgi:hypothetical protein
MSSNITFSSILHEFEHFQLTLLKELVDQIPSSIEYQCWYGPGLELCDFSNSTISVPNYLIIYSDTYERYEFDHTCQTKTPTTLKLLGLIEKNPCVKFFLFTKQENLSCEIQHPRLQIVNYGSGLCREKNTYQTLTAQTYKNMHSQKTFVCFNRNPRQHRINLVSYLLGLSLEKYGTISFNDPLSANTWLERASWTLTENQEKIIKPILMQGFDKIKVLDLKGSIVEQVDKIYSKGLANNPENFDLYLRNIYSEHFVEIISETQFNFCYFGVTEKFLNSVYGCNFPIVLGGPGVVNFLRTLGFDMFDDVIDHSYDLISDPLDRLCTAIDLNMRVLVDNHRVKQLWNQHQQRFINNIHFAKTQMYDIFEQRVRNNFSNISWHT